MDFTKRKSMHIACHMPCAVYRVSLALLLSFSAFGGMRTVSIDVDSVAGALRSVIDAASPGDTVVFDCPGTDTVKMKGPIALERDIVIIGKNASMRGRIVLQGLGQGSLFVITGCQATFAKVTLQSNAYADSGGIFSVKEAATTLVVDSATIGRGGAKGGGALYVNAGTVRVTNSRILNSSNSGIYNNGGHCIINGSILSGNYSSDYGGAILNLDGTMDLGNDSISDNESYYDGGAITLYKGSITLDHCVISGNSSRSGAGGGAVYMSSGTLDASACTIVHNSCPKGNGGAMLIYGGVAKFIESDISNNFAIRYGGAIYMDKGQLSITGGSLKNDSACWVYDYKSKPTFSSSPNGSTAGGAIYNVLGTIDMSGVLISGNRSSVMAEDVDNAGNDLAYFGYSTAGGAFYNIGGTMTFTRCTLSDNTTYASASSGSSIVGINSESAGGCIYNDSGRITMTNSAIVNCSCFASASSYAYNTHKEYSTGCGIYNKSGSLFLLNATIAKNVFSGASGSGGCFYNESGKIIIVHGTIAGNGARNSETGGAAALQMGKSGSCFLLNTIVSANKTGDFYSSSDLKSRAVNSIFGVGRPSIVKNCLIDSASLRLFGASNPTPSASGNTPPTLSLGTFSSVAIGAGARAGTYASPNAAYTLPEAAYFDTIISDWRTLETDERLPSDIIVNEITADQRGKPRLFPPCVGAFEMTSGDPVRAALYTTRRAPSLLFYGNRLGFYFNKTADAELCVYNLLGKRICKTTVKLSKGINFFTLPKFSPGVLLCRIAASHETIELKLKNAP